jgi:Zn finger protein HypA/HybF involved in hydrogenase expression
MHEAGLVADALNHALAAAQEAGAVRIRRVSFRVASPGHVTPDVVENWFGLLSRGTIAEGAEVVVDESVFLGSGMGAGGDSPALGDVPELVLESIDVDDS